MSLPEPSPTTPPEFSGNGSSEGLSSDALTEAVTGQAFAQSIYQTIGQSIAPIKDSVLVVTNDEGQGSELQQIIQLRAFEQFLTARYADAFQMIQSNTPKLIIMDASRNRDAAVALVNQMSHWQSNQLFKPSLLILDSAFDEHLFLIAHETGARDYLVAPIQPSYFMSRVFLALEDQRLQKEMIEKDVILQELGVYGAYSNMYTTAWFIKLLDRMVKEYVHQYPPDSLSFMLITVGGFNKELSSFPELRKIVYRMVSANIMKACRQSDIPGEYFEYKFGLILPFTRLEGAQILAERIRRNLDGKTFPFKGQIVSLRTQIGLTDLTHCTHYEELLEKVHRALPDHPSPLGATGKRPL